VNGWNLGLCRGGFQARPKQLHSERVAAGSRSYKDRQKVTISSLLGMFSFRPQITEVHFDLLKRFNADFSGPVQGIQQQPSAGFEPVDLQGRLLRVD
jgi:hypothetical protein